MRTAPDVSYDADPNTGFYVYTTVGGNGWSVIGGTSAGAPQWSALVALADQWRALAYGVGSLDGPNQTLPALYSDYMSQDYIDITAGYNGYYAGPGYDLVTGLGSPWAPYVVSDLAYAGIGFGPSALAPQSVTAGRPEAILGLSNPDLLPMHARTVNAVDAAFADPAFAGTAASTPAADLTDPSQGADKFAALVESLASHARSHDLWQLDQPGFLDLDAADVGMLVIR
jgi:hypothetical protein